MQSQKPKAITALDIVFIVSMTAVAVASVPLIQSHIGDIVVVYRDNTVIARYPVDEDRTFTVKGADGGLTVEISNRRVRVVSSTCARQVCRNHVPVGRPFESIVCAPNHILIELRSSRSKLDTDAYTY